MSTDVRPDPTIVVIFGGNGDLARRKLLPSLYHLHLEGLMPADWRVIGNARSEVSDEEFRRSARQAVEEFGRCGVDEDAWTEFEPRLSFCSGRFDPEHLNPLAEAIKHADEDLGGDAQLLCYLSTPPPTFGPITEGLGASGLSLGARVVYEKPFGMDHASFVELDRTVRANLDEEQVYRIDHFLGKENVQNVLALRFANGFFEAVWNRDHIDHVQIDVPETLGIGTRAGFYEKTGALRDMLVTHLFQVLSVVALEPPTRLQPVPLVNEKVKVFESMRPLRHEDVVLGQYDGYLDEDGVDPDSRTDTFVAARVFIDNWRWQGVPFYLRTGKRMPVSRQTITLAFRKPPATMFEGMERANLARDHLTFELSGEEGMTLTFMAKEPGQGYRVAPTSMTFDYRSFDRPLIEAYERLIHDALCGDPTLYTRADGIARVWEVIDPILSDPPDPIRYPQDSWGPDEAGQLIAPRQWHLTREQQD